MSEKTRTDFLSPHVRAEIDRSDAARRRRIAAALAVAVVAGVPDVPDVIRLAANAIASGHLDGEAARRVADEAAHLDEVYLDLHDDEKPGGRSDGWEAAFRVARAAATVRFAFDPSAEQAAREAAYEATFALGEDDHAIAEIVRGVT